MKKIESVKHVLITSTHNIGDVLLTLPLAGILKQHFPAVKISFLAREYTRAMVEQSMHVDTFLSWDVLSQLPSSSAIEAVKSSVIDVVIHVVPNKKIAMLMKKAGVPNRIGTSRRWYHWLTCNRRVSLSHKKSTQHEAQINLKLLSPFQLAIQDDLPYLYKRMGLRTAAPLSPRLASLLRPNQFNLIIHPFTNGHTREWPVSHFNALIQQLPRDRFHFIITGSEAENEMIKTKMMPYGESVTNLAGQCSLQEFIQLIAHADGLVANATGPLHVAAAFGIHALGLYPITKGIDPVRWRPIGKQAEFLAADPACQKPLCRDKPDCFCMESITVDQVKNKIMRWL